MSSPRPRSRLLLLVILVTAVALIAVLLTARGERGRRVTVPEASLASLASRRLDLARDCQQARVRRTEELARELLNGGFALREAAQSLREHREAERSLPGYESWGDL